MTLPGWLHVDLQAQQYEPTLAACRPCDPYVWLDHSQTLTHDSKSCASVMLLHLTPVVQQGLPCELSLAACQRSYLLVLFDQTLRMPQSQAGVQRPVMLLHWSLVCQEAQQFELSPAAYQHFGPQVKLDEG